MHGLRHSMPPFSSSTPSIPFITLSIPSSSSLTRYFLWLVTTSWHWFSPFSPFFVSSKLLYVVCIPHILLVLVSSIATTICMITWWWKVIPEKLSSKLNPWLKRRCLAHHGLPYRPLHWLEIFFFLWALIEQGWKRTSGNFEWWQVVPSDGQVHRVILAQCLGFNCIL
jgi:hypothetical protein